MYLLEDQLSYLNDALEEFDRTPGETHGRIAVLHLQRNLDRVQSQAEEYSARVYDEWEASTEQRAQHKRALDKRIARVEKLIDTGATLLNERDRAEALVAVRDATIAKVREELARANTLANRLPSSVRAPSPEPSTPSSVHEHEDNSNEEYNEEHFNIDEERAEQASSVTEGTTPAEGHDLTQKVSVGKLTFQGIGKSGLTFEGVARTKRSHEQAPDFRKHLRNKRTKPDHGPDHEFSGEAKEFLDHLIREHDHGTDPVYADDDAPPRRSARQTSANAVGLLTPPIDRYTS